MICEWILSEWMKNTNNFLGPFWEGVLRLEFVPATCESRWSRKFREILTRSWRKMTFRSVILLCLFCLCVRSDVVVTFSDGQPDRIFPAVNIVYGISKPEFSSLNSDEGITSFNVSGGFFFPLLEEGCSEILESRGKILIVSEGTRFCLGKYILNLIFKRDVLLRR